MKMNPCQWCNGTGKSYDHAYVGAEMRKFRKSRGVVLRVVADKLGYSIPYLSDLEKGYRNWRTDLIEKFKKACQ